MAPFIITPKGVPACRCRDLLDFNSYSIEPINDDCDDYDGAISGSHMLENLWHKAVNLNDGISVSDRRASLGANLPSLSQARDKDMDCGIFAKTLVTMNDSTSM